MATSRLPALPGGSTRGRYALGMSADPDVQLVRRFGRFLWAHRTIVAGVVALWNVAGIFIEPLLAPPPLPQWPGRVVPVVAAGVFAILCIASFIYDRRAAMRRNNATAKRKAPAA